MTTPKPIEKPMLFSEPMVRALLDGRKTQTRRVVKPQPKRDLKTIDGSGYGFIFLNTPPKGITPPHPVGSRIWVRETWQAVPVYYDDYNGGNEAGYPYPEIPKEKPSNAWISYAADRDEGPWRPAIHMPRWASRITLEVTDVRVQRLQEISEEDALAEGPPDVESDTWPTIAEYHPRDAFAALWESIYGPDAWEQNPWVWAYTFKRVEVDYDHA